MPYVMNCLQDPVSVQIFGNWITIAAGQIKLVSNEKIAYKMVTDLAYKGLVEIPESVMEDRNSPESKAIIADKKIQGITSRMNHLQTVWRNLDVSLRQDLQKSGSQADPYSFASQGELNALKEMKKYKGVVRQDEVDRAEAVRNLKEELDGDINSTNTGTSNTGNKNPSGPTTRRE